jgi:hypothetical protein
MMVVLVLLFGGIGVGAHRKSLRCRFQSDTAKFNRAHHNNYYGGDDYIVMRDDGLWISKAIMATCKQQQPPYSY